MSVKLFEEGKGIHTTLKKRVLFLIIMFMGINIVISMFAFDAQAYNNIIFNNITIENGLSQATIEAMVQDKYGYIWFGTNDGLEKYNGYDFKTYRNEIGVKNSICNNYITSLAMDNEENILYAGTTDGLSRINLENDEITNFSDEDGLSNTTVLNILVTKSNDIVVATSDGLNLFNRETSKFERIFEGDNLAGQEIYYLKEDDYGYIWVGSSNGLNRVNLSSNESINYSENGLGIVNDGVYSLLCDGDYISIGTISSGIVVLNYKTEEYINVTKENDNLPSNSINNIIKDQNGYYWAATDAGLAKYDLTNNKTITYINKIYDKYSLVNNNVFILMQDKSGLIWAGTYSGVSKFNPETKMEHYKVDELSTYGINDNVIHGIYEDNDGLVWVGTNTKGINVLDRKNEKSFYLDIDSKPYALSSNSINDVKGYENYVFIATNEGLNILDKNTNTIEVYGESQGLLNRKIKSLRYDSKGNLWIGTINGVNILNLKTREMTNLNDLFEKNEIKDYYIESIYEDSEGIIWIGTFFHGGLIKLNPSTNEIVQYQNKEDENSISNNCVRTIIEDSKGYLWIGTSGGLNRYSKESGTFKVYSTRDGMNNNTVYGILLDEDENLWMSTNSGVSKLDRKNDRFYNLTITDGLQSNEFNGAAYCKTKSGELIFGGINGLNIFNPEDLFKDSFNNSVQFDEFIVNKESIKNINNMSLTHNQNDIGIKLFMPDYKNFKNIEYYYKVNDNDEWMSIKGNEIYLSNLSSGKYNISVKAKNSNGEFSDVSQVCFNIKPAFWKSPIAIILYSAGIGIIIGAIIDSKNEKMRILDNMVTERTMKLHEEMNKNTELLNKVIDLEKNKNAYLVNISHELRTPLNVLSSMEQLISELNRTEEGISRDKIDHYMRICKKNITRLLKLINDLIDTSKIEHGNYNINISENDIVYIVEETSLSIKDYIESKNINLIIDPEVEECMIDCDAVEIERCIINLVNNAAKFTNPGGQILISLVELEEEVKIEVSDTGIGIEEKHLEIIFNRFNQVVDSKSETKGGSGLGLTITKLIVELHGGRIFAESTVGVGSKFTIILPKKVEEKKI